MESSFNLNGKIALVTGSAGGIGWATAKTFARFGATVILNDIKSKEILEGRKEELKKDFNCDAEAFQFDVGNFDAVQNAYNDIFKKYKRLDILVNNAGALFDNLVGMIRKQDIEQTFSTNTNGVIYNLQFAARLMQRNKSGSIINIASIVGRVGNEGQVVYGGSKAAVIGITLSAARELAPKNIRVNAIAPGFINTDLIKPLSQEIYNQRLNSIKMKRIGQPEDVANAVLFLASDMSTYITGQVLGVDGGMIM
ncbi:MAG: SDR family NAD(P)-dependent oxidoreductase [Ignavibacteriaceae bacterium]